MIHHGDCLDVMAQMEPESVDAIVTDPPYDLTGHRWDSLGPGASPKQTAHTKGRGGFMGKAWDGTGIAFRPELWEAAYRVAKPSAYLLAFGGTRTVHRMTCALEDAGWIIRDMLVWAYATGFPKSKATLKPAWEPIVMARKPGPLRELAIDACRIPSADEDRAGWYDALGSGPKFTGQTYNGGRVYEGSGEPPDKPAGRWPANIILTDPIFDGGIEGVVGGGEQDSGPPHVTRRQERGGYDGGWSGDGSTALVGDGRGTYSRFFLIPKADRADREPVLGGLSGLDARQQQASIHADPNAAWAHKNPNHPRRNGHPTVKPTELMRHLVRLVTPPGGLVLDPFLGSGTTGLACELEGFPWVGIEREAEYVAIAEARLNGTQKGMGLVG